VDKTCKNTVAFFKKITVNPYANHVYVFLIVCPSTIFILCILIKLSTTNDIEKHSVYNYAALQNNTKARNYSIVKRPNMENETVCKFRSNIKDMYFEHYASMFRDNLNQNETFRFDASKSLFCFTSPQKVHAPNTVL
jgi:hypothetical protein